MSPRCAKLLCPCDVKTGDHGSQEVDDTRRDDQHIEVTGAERCSLKNDHTWRHPINVCSVLPAEDIYASSSTASSMSKRSEVFSGGLGFPSSSMPHTTGCDRYPTNVQFQISLWVRRLQKMEGPCTKEGQHDACPQAVHRRLTVGMHLYGTRMQEPLLNWWSRQSAVAATLVSLVSFVRD